MESTPSKRPAPQNTTPSPEERERRLRETVAELQEGLDNLRLTMKYLVFDLEATRREREHASEIAHQMMARVNRQNQIIATYRRRYGA